MLATHKVFVDSFRDLYPLNKNATAPNAVAVGRYPEDTYFEGNPWYICTLAAAEILYDAVAQISKAGQLTIDQYSLGFFKDIYPAAKEMVYKGDTLKKILSAMTNYGDGFVKVVQVCIFQIPPFPPSMPPITYRKQTSFLTKTPHRPTNPPTAPSLNNSTKQQASPYQPTT
jgi:hypothetical protein